MNTTVSYLSTFRAKDGTEALMRLELQRLVSYTRREKACVACDLFQLTTNKKIFVVQTVWSSHDVWMTRKGWEHHPAGPGLLDQCLQRPVEVVPIEEVA